MQPTDIEVYDGPRRGQDQARAHQIRGLSQRLNAVWRSVGDDRENTAELVHSDGTPVETKIFVGREETIRTLATWAVNMANEHAVQLNYGTPQRYDLIFNSTPIPIWVKPAHGDAAGQLFEMGLSTVLGHHEQLLGQFFEDKQHTLAWYERMMNVLERENDRLRQAAIKAGDQQLEYTKAVGEIYRDKARTDLEIEKEKKAQERWDKAADTTLGYIGMGINEAMKDFQAKRAKTRGDTPIDNDTIGMVLEILTGNMTPLEAESFGKIMRDIKARNEARAREAKPTVEPAKGSASAANEPTAAVVTPPPAAPVVAPEPPKTPEPPKPEPEGAK
jgi:hypothetical protein